MKTAILILALLLTASAGTAAAQEGATDRITLELTDPDQPAYLKVGLINGGIKVIGYEGS